MSNEPWQSKKQREQAKREIDSQLRDVAIDNKDLGEIVAKIDGATSQPELARLLAVAVRLESGRKKWEKEFTRTRNAALHDVRVQLKSLKGVNEWLDYEHAVWEADHNVIFLKQIPDAIRNHARELLAWAKDREEQLSELEFRQESSGAFVPSQGVAIEFLSEKVGLKHKESALLCLCLEQGGDEKCEAFVGGQMLALSEPLGIEDVELCERTLITRLHEYRQMMTPEERAKLVQRMEEDGGPM